ncbi:hypothetical protein [Mesorhizobium sp. f-mel]
MPEFMGDGKILEPLVVVFGRVDDGGRVAGEYDRPRYALHIGWLRLESDVPCFGNHARLDGKLREAELSRSE